MTEPDPTPAQQIDALCDEFEAAWKAGNSPPIEDYLPRIAADHQGVLLEELLKLELHYRRQRGEAVQRADYLQRFPAQQGLIESLLSAEHTPTLVGHPEGIRVRCPHCHQPLEILPEESLKDVTCSSCGSSFNLLADTETVSQASGAGQRLGQFELKETLGSGAFGTVWKARDTILDRLVACKIPRASDLSEDDREKFFREARAAAQLRHENIVSVHEVGRDGDTIFIISDFVDGLTLADWLTGQQPSVREAAEIIRQVALALHHAHQKGIIHRDIKPSNIMLDAELKPHVMDFGLAKREAGEITMTVSGAILGTPAYMSPEQARGDAHQVDARSDVYSLGVVLFELLTGERPFRGNVRMLLHQVMRDEPPGPRKLNGAIPKDLETICLKCLEKSPEQRYPSAAALAEDLQHWLTGHPISARPVGRVERLWRWARRNPTLAGSLAVITLLLLVLSIGGPLMAWQQAGLKQTVETTNASLETANTGLETALKQETALKGSLQTALRNETTAKTDALHRLYASQIAQASAHLLAGDRVAARQALLEIPADQWGWEAGYLFRLISGTPLTLYGHHGEVRSVAFSPDGLRVVSGSDDQTVKVWDAVTGGELLTLRGHAEPVRNVAFSPDGQRIFSVSRTSFTVWDAHTGREIPPRHDDPDWNWLCAFSPDGTRVVGVRPWDKSLLVWDTGTGQQLLTLDGHVEAVNAVVFSQDGTRIVSCSEEDFSLRIWDARTGRNLLTLSGQEWVSSAGFSPDGSRIVSDFGRNLIKVRDAGSGQDMFTLTGPDHPVTSLVYSPDGTRLAGSLADLLQVWDARTRKPLLTLRGHQILIRCVAFSPDGLRIVSGGIDQTIKIWDVYAEQGPQTLRGHQYFVNSAAYSPDGEWIASAGSDKTVKLWNARTGQELFSLAGHQDFVWCVAFHPQGTRIVSSSADQTMKIWDTQTGQELLSFRGHQEQESIHCVAYSPDGLRIVSGSNDDTIKIWDAETGRELRTLAGHEDDVWQVVYSPDGRQILSAGHDRTLRIWDAESGRELRTLRGHQNYVNSVAYSPDGRWIASGSQDETVKLWDAGSGQEVLTLRGHQWGVDSVAFSPDSLRIVSSSDDHTLKVWDVQTGRELLTLRGHESGVTGVQFSPRGGQIVSSSWDHTIKLWDAQVSQVPETLRGHQNLVTRVAFSPDGTRIVSGSEDQTLKVWESGSGVLLSTEAWSEQRFEELAAPGKTTEGPLTVVPDGVNILLLRRNREYDPWAEDESRRAYWAPIWHTRDAIKAEKGKDWFAARFHLRWLVQHKPDDQELKTRLQRAETAWQAQQAKLAEIPPVEAPRP